MIKHKAYKYRLYPTKEQEILLAKHFGCNRFIYNYFLDLAKKAYQENKEKIEAERINKNISYYENAALLTQLKKQPKLEWLKETNSQSLQATLKNLETAYKRFFQKKSKFPKFKSKYGKQSYKVPQSIIIKDSRVSIPKFKDGIKVKIHRALEGKILSATISKNSAEQYFISITCELDIKPLLKNNKAIGIDLGIKTFVVCSDEIDYDLPKTIKELDKKIKYRHKQLSKKKKGSNNRNKARVKLAKTYLKIHNIRQDFLHKTSTEIIKNHGIICIEDLAVKDMMSNHRLAKSIGDQAWGELCRQLGYKSDWYGRELVAIDRYFPSSKTCHVCGFINQNLALSERVWICPNCESLLNRDGNASLNIERQGLNLINRSGGNRRVKPLEPPALAGAMN